MFKGKERRVARRSESSSASSHITTIFLGLLLLCFLLRIKELSLVITETSGCISPSLILSELQIFQANQTIHRTNGQNFVNGSTNRRVRRHLTFLTLVSWYCYHISNTPVVSVDYISAAANRYSRTAHSSDASVVAFGSSTFVALWSATVRIKFCSKPSTTTVVFRKTTKQASIKPYQAMKVS